MILEACVASVESACRAHAGGADRLELNRALDRDGLTPSRGLYRDVLTAVPLPIIVMTRPHDRGYVYDDHEWAELEAEVDYFLSRGAIGVAIGALTPSGAVDTGRMRRIVDQVEGREVVCHRAFDEVRDPADALEALIDCGVTRVLTSGQGTTALEGVATLASLVELAAGRIEILPAAGIGPKNVPDLIRETGCRQVHGTFRDHASGSPETDRRVVVEVRRALDTLS